MLSSKNVIDGSITHDNPRYLSKEDFDLEDKRTRVRPGDILMTIVGTIGRTAIVPKNAGNLTFQRSVAVLHIDHQQIDPVFLKSCLDSIQADIDAEAHGSSQKGIYLNQVEKIPVLVPDLSIQKKFSSFVQQVDKSKVIKESVKSRFIEMFGHINLNEKNLPMKTLNEVCLLVTDGSHYSPADEPDGKYPMLSVKDLSNGKFNYSDCKHINQGEYDKLVKDGCKPIKNDVLIAKDGSVFQKSMIITDEIDQVILSSIAIIRPDTDVANPVYLERYLMSDYVKEDVINNYTTGTAIRRIILKNLAKLKLIVPEIEAQNEFASFVQQVDKSKVGAPSTILLINIYINTEA